MVAQLRAEAHWRTFTWVTFLVQALVTVLHVFPSLIYSQRPTTARVVVALSHMGPIWVVLFGATALGLLAGWLSGRGLKWAHLLSGSVWVIYTAALVCGAFAQQPHGTLILPLVTLALAGLHTVGASVYDDKEGKRRRARRAQSPGVSE